MGDGVGGVGQSSPQYDDYQTDSSGGAQATGETEAPCPDGGTGTTDAAGSDGTSAAANANEYSSLPDLSETPTGVGGLPPNLLPKMDYDHQSSNQVKTLGESAQGGLKDAAAKNTTGPEAKLSKYVEGQTKAASDEIRGMEDKAAKLPLGSPERKALENQIDQRVQRYRNDVGIETQKTAAEIKANAGGDKGAVDKFAFKLPPYMKEAVKREGAWIPGVPGGFQPRTDNGGVAGGPTGVNWGGKW